LTSADDYADLMEQTVRELRYAPIDREYSAHILSRCVHWGVREACCRAATGLGFRV